MAQEARKNDGIFGSSGRVRHEGPDEVILFQGWSLLGSRSAARSQHRVLLHPMSRPSRVAADILPPLGRLNNLGSGRVTVAELADAVNEARAGAKS